jgi:hypothetical protein
MLYVIITWSMVRKLFKKFHVIKILAEQMITIVGTFYVGRTATNIRKMDTFFWMPLLLMVVLLLRDGVELCIKI